tara:strand:- start:13 stop:228 length:216 start_codon:yes stop_codon:yes gene_type:complete
LPTSNTLGTLKEKITVNKKTKSNDVLFKEKERLKNFLKIIINRGKNKHTTIANTISAMIEKKRTTKAVKTK